MNDPIIQLIGRLTGNYPYHFDNQEHDDESIFDRKIQEEEEEFYNLNYNEFTDEINEFIGE